MSTTLEPATAPALTKHAITVLLVDDQAMIGEAVRRMLASETDIRFHHCVDPAQTFSVAAAISPTVILQDLVMPGVNGLTLVRYLRANPATRDVPIIVLSTKEDAKVKADAFSLGANDYVVKLPDGIELIARIRYHSRGYIAMLERNEAYEALVVSQKQLEMRNRFIRETFGRYLSDEVVSSLLETPEGLSLGGEKRKVTIMMTDLRGFTPLSERLSPEQVVRIINNYLGAMTDIIVAYGGTIDEFIGDAILVIFGAPVLREDDARRAVACALAMQLAIPHVNAKNRDEGLPDIEMGIGLNTGEVVVGNIGSSKRAKYGVVGSQVNLTSRIESFTVGGQILASESTVREAGGDLRIDGEMRVEPKGVTAPITIYDVGGIGAPHALALPRAGEDLATLAAPLSILLRVVETKDSGGEMLAASIVALSARGAEVRAEPPLAPSVTLKLRIAPGADGAPDEIFYGKTLARKGAGGGIYVRFTSVPDAVKVFLASAPRENLFPVPVPVPDP